jgi:hypothetical protein
MKLCEFGICNNKGFNIYLMCNKTNSICVFVRYCAEERCLKMTDSYSKCKARNSDGKKEKED